MKISKTYETLLKGDEDQARQLFEELQRNEFSGAIEDWDAFINLLHDKRLKAQSEVIALNYLSANILEGSYQDSLSGSSDSKIILNLLNIMSFKIKSQTDETKRILSIGYGSIYCYLCCQIFSHLQDFNDTHKKIKQRIEEDAKHLIKLLEFGFSELLPAARSSSSRIHLIEQFRAFIIELTSLLKKQPHIFKNQAKFIEHIILSSMESKTQQESGSNPFPYSILDESIQPEVINLISHLPRCVNTVAAYPDRVKYFLNKYFDNFYYGFLFLCRGTDTKTILTNFAFDETFKSTPTYLFDWQHLLEVHSSNTSSSSKSVVIRVASIERLQILSKLIISTISNVKCQSVHAWNLKKYFDVISQILQLDSNYIENNTHNSKKALNSSGIAQRFDVSVLETEKLSLPKEEYLLVSMQSKEFALQILETLIKVIGTGMLRHTEWFYNILYFVTITYETSEQIMKVLLKTCTTIFKQVGSMFFEFGEYLLFQSPLAPLELLSECYSTNTPSKFATSLHQEILRTAESYLIACGRIQTKAELIGQLDALASKALSNTSVVFKSNYKQDFFSFLEAILLNNSLKYEESQLLGEMNSFLDQYTIQEKDSSLLNTVESLQALVFSLRQTKRITYIENANHLNTYFQNQFQMIQKEENAETCVEDGYESSMLESHIPTSPHCALDMEESWGGTQVVNSQQEKQKQKGANPFSLKRTFTDLMGDDMTASTSLNSKKVIIVEKKDETFAVSKTLPLTQEEDEELVLNPLLDSDSD